MSDIVPDQAVKRAEVVNAILSGELSRLSYSQREGLIDLVYWVDNHCGWRFGGFGGSQLRDMYSRVLEHTPDWQR